MAETSNPTQTSQVDTFGHFVSNVMRKDNGKYVFHDARQDAIASAVIPELIPIPVFIPHKTIYQLRISRIYAGGKYSGTNLHQHSSALNYLVSGKKLWITFPFNSKNKKFVDKHKIDYGYIKDKTIDWFVANHTIFSSENAVDDLRIFVQNAGEVVYVPRGCYHAVINLDDVLGITYSWNDENLKRP